jgi:ATP-dependent DNA helicase RecG
VLCREGKNKAMNQETDRIEYKEILMGIFQKLHFVEGGGTGIPDIVSFYGREAFYFSNSITRLSLKFDKNMEEEERAKSEEKSEEKSGEKSGEKILAAISANNRITTKELQAIVGIGKTAIYNNIKALKEAGKLRRVGADKGGYWEVIEK